MKKELFWCTAVLLAGVATAVLADEACYGVVVAGENECATSSNVCARHALEDGLKDAYIYVPDGLCTRLVNGSLEPDS